MDPRVRGHAELLVEHCVDIQQGDEVVIRAPIEAEELAVALHTEVAKRGGFPLRVTGMRNDARPAAAFITHMTPDAYDGPSRMLTAMAEETDVFILIKSAGNNAEGSSVPPANSSAFSQLVAPAMTELRSGDWVGTQHPDLANAQSAGMNTDEYADFVYDAIDLDWDAQRAFQAQLVDILEAGSEVRIVSGDTTDVTMSIEGNVVMNDHGKRNLPGGEVYTAPVIDSVEGEVVFDMPVTVEGRELADVRLVFEDGTVVDHGAAKNEAVLEAVLETDDGSRSIGELGIGMNRQIDRFTHNMLFDEKMGDTVHLALGNAYPWTVGEDNEINDSSRHVDMLVDMSKDSFIAVDGEVVQRDGTFVFEEEFEA